MGKRADALLLTERVVFLLEFKVGATAHSTQALDQVEDYALDLKNFHEGSHTAPIIPILISTHAAPDGAIDLRFGPDLVAQPIGTDADGLVGVINSVLADCTFPHIESDEWMSKGYKPTPTIVEAAEVLYRKHSVTDISRSGAGVVNLQETSASVSRVIDGARVSSKKAICFVTGVPGSERLSPA